MKNFFYQKNVAIACKDPGSANLIFYLLKHIKPKKINYYTQNPATKLFKTYSTKKYSTKKIGDLFEKMDFFICGTGRSNFEKKALIRAKKSKIYTLSIIDHYTKYKERFCYNKKYYFPDEILSTGKEAFKIAKSTFPKIKITLIKNYYLSDFKKRFTSIKKKNKKYIIYASEPYIDLKLNYELESLTYLLNNFDKMPFKSKEIIIKLHPKDKINKYDKIIKRFKHKIKISINNDLDNVSLLSQTEAVVGLCSYLLLISLSCGIKTYSCILPNQNRIKRLNKKNIQNIPDKIKI